MFCVSFFSLRFAKMNRESHGLDPCHEGETFPEPGMLRLSDPASWLLRVWEYSSIHGIIKALGVQRLLIQWSFRKDHCFTRDLHQQFQGTIILMVFDLQGRDHWWLINRYTTWSPDRW